MHRLKDSVHLPAFWVNWSLKVLPTPGPSHTLFGSLTAFEQVSPLRLLVFLVGARGLNYFSFLNGWHGTFALQLAPEMTHHMMRHWDSPS
jgi:hypothetical protein